MKLYPKRLRMPYQKAVGLSKEYNDNTSDVGKWLGNIFGMPFLNPEEVGDCFAMDFISGMPQNNKLTTFSDYIYDTYISDDALFPPHMWALRSETVTRTTNAVEFFHSHFKNNFYMTHPNIHNFLNVLLQLQSEVYIKIRSIGTIQTRKRTLVRKNFILNEIKKYKEGEKTRFEYVQSVSCYLKKK
ncbi:hypothetical protein AGLY_016849 [Aphis glycines]|uniref:MULE transposase domain-containing protein n=1 Tax=Aphis glycines TaxID=307491 RepID=A0A6G0SWH1_APHGL|nr:hypothetical protein AGLY_016849 [Aphis glycines]